MTKIKKDIFDKLDKIRTELEAKYHNYERGDIDLLIATYIQDYINKFFKI